MAGHFVMSCHFFLKDLLFVYYEVLLLIISAGYHRASFHTRQTVTDTLKKAFRCICRFSFSGFLSALQGKLLPRKAYIIHVKRYVADYPNNLVRTVTPDGMVSLLYRYMHGGGSDQDGPVAAAKANRPNMVSVTRDGSLVFLQRSAAVKMQHRRCV